MKSHHVRSWFGWLVGMLLLAACVAPSAPAGSPPAAEQPAAASEAKILRIRTETDLTNADPAFHPATMDTLTLESVGEGLVGYKVGTWELENVLAEEIKSSEDGKTIEFTLRAGVQFQKGYGELTAEDVKFSYERFIDPKLEASYKDDWAALDRVEVMGKYTGKIILKDSFAPLWNSTMPVAGGTILSKKAVEEMGVEKYATNPVGTGPYEFSEWRPKERVILKRFDGYWGKKAAFDEIHLVPIEDNAAAEIAMETGEIDAGPLPLDAVTRFQANDQFTVQGFNSLGYNGIFLNVQHPNLADIKVREAVRYAIDVPAILTDAYEDRHTRACAVVAEGQIGYWAEAPCYERDVAKAKALLAEAGVDALDLTLAYLEGSESKAQAEIIQASLAEAGINVELVQQDAGAYWDGGFGDEGLRNRQLAIFEWTTNNPDPYWQTFWFTCDQVGQWNWTYSCNEAFDVALQTGVTELDPAKRSAAIIELQKAWDADVSTIWTAHPTTYFAVSKAVEAAFSPNRATQPWKFKPTQ
jgi:peptide/nickel transport system substrate-binding protein